MRGLVVFGLGLGEVRSGPCPPICPPQRRDHRTPGGLGRASTRFPSGNRPRSCRSEDRVPAVLPWAFIAGGVRGRCTWDVLLDHCAQPPPLPVDVPPSQAVRLARAAKAGVAREAEQQSPLNIGTRLDDLGGLLGRHVVIPISSDNRSTAVPAGAPMDGRRIPSKYLPVPAHNPAAPIALIC